MHFDWEHAFVSSGHAWLSSWKLSRKSWQLPREEEECELWANCSLGYLHDSYSLFSSTSRRRMINEISTPKNSEVHGDKKGRGCFIFLPRFLVIQRGWHWGQQRARLLEISMENLWVSLIDKTNGKWLALLLITSVYSNIFFKVLKFYEVRDSWKVMQLILA